MKCRCVTFLLCLLIFFLPVPSLFSADLLVPEMELTTRGYIENQTLNLATLGTFDLLIAGGYKFGGRLALNIEGENLEDLTTDNPLNFEAASIVLRDVFRLPMNISYFIGRLDTLCNGDIFQEQYGTEQIGTRYRGYAYFPEGVRYDGIYDIAGTGMALTANFSDNFTTSAYIYQDAIFGTGIFSADIRTVLNLELFKLEAFIGSSFPVSNVGIYRGGLFLFYKTNTGGEFLTQIGIPKWDPWHDPFDIDLFYFLFEPRVKLNIFSIILTLFWHPAFYMGTETNELGSVDINVNFLIGNPELSTFSGGLENSLKFSTTSTEQFQTYISPYFSAITSGVIWNFKVNTKVFPYALEDLFEFFVGVKAEF